MVSKAVGLLAAAKYTFYRLLSIYTLSFLKSAWQDLIGQYFGFYSKKFFNSIASMCLHSVDLTGVCNLVFLFRAHSKGICMNSFD